MAAKVLIIEAYTDANIGSGALVLNAIRAVRRILPEADIAVMAHYPKAFDDWEGVRSVPDMFDYPYGRSRISQLAWLGATVVWMVWVSACAVLGIRKGIEQSRARMLGWADLVLSVGAERLNDKYPKNIAFSLFTYWLVKRLGRRMVLLPCTVGPLFRRTTRYFCGRVLRRLDLVLVRDHESYENVRSICDIDESRLIETADLALMQRPYGGSKQTLVACNNEAEKQPQIGISPMRWTYVHNSHETLFSNYDAYRREMAALADALVERFNARIVFFPTNYPERGCREDDVQVAREIRALMKHAAQSSIVEQLPSAAEFMHLMSRSTVNITTRMHACILSTAAYVPTISVNYLFKLSGYMRSLGMERFSLDIEDFNAAHGLALFDRLWEERDQRRRQLETVINERRSCVSNAMERLRDLV